MKYPPYEKNSRVKRKCLGGGYISISNTVAYSAGTDRLQIREEAVIAVADITIVYMVQGLKVLYLWLLHQAAARSYFKDMKMYFQSLETDLVGLKHIISTKESTNCDMS
jgi:hypothetical protein